MNNKKKENKSKIANKYVKKNMKKNYSKSGINYNCNECEYQSDNLGRINAHMICHTNKRPFVCDQIDCYQSFKRQQSLKRHIKTRHLNERLYCCHICNKRFTQSNSLNDHLFLHSEQKNAFKCGINGCNKSFQTPKYLKSHQKRRHKKSDSNIQSEDHSTNNSNDKESIVEKPYLCSFPNCQQSFQLKRSLTSHEKFSHKTQDKLESRKTSNLKTNNQLRSNSMTSNTNNTVDVIEQICNNSFVFDCNFINCVYKTTDFEKIADHFEKHWRFLKLN